MPQAKHHTDDIHHPTSTRFRALGLGLLSGSTGTIAGVIFSALLQVTLAGLLPVSEFSAYSAIVVIVTLWSSLAALGLNRNGISTLLRCDTAGRAHAVVVMLQLVGITAPVAAIATATCVLLLIPAQLMSSTGTNLVLIALLASAETFRYSVAPLSIAWERHVQAVVLGLPGRNALLLVWVCLVSALGDLNLRSLLIVLTSTTTVLAGLSVLRIIKLSSTSVRSAPTLSREPPRSDGPTKASLLKSGWTLALANVLMLGINQGDILVVAWHFEPGQTAVYVLTTRFARLAGTLRPISSAIVMPQLRFSRSRESRDHNEAILRHAATLTALPMAGFALISYWPVSMMLDRIFPSNQADAALIFAILVAGQVSGLLAGLPTALIMRAQRNDIVLKCVAGAGFTTLTAQILCSRGGSLIGVAVASAVGVTVNNVLLALWCRSKMGVRCAPYGRPRDIGCVAREFFSEATRRRAL